MWQIFDYLTPSGRNDIYKWAMSFNGERRGKFEQKLDTLRKNGTDVPKDLLAYLGDGIYKLKVQGKPQLRPFLCRGVNDNEFTILLGVIEENNEYRPKDALEQARERLAQLLANPDQRCKHKRAF